MTDLHTHILPAMDDGAADPAESLELLRLEREQGVDRVVLTPHFYREREGAARFLERRERAFEALLRAGAPADGPELLLGAEVAWFPSLTAEDRLEELCLAGTTQLLLELPFEPWSAMLLDRVYGFALSTGLTPVFAHVERYLPLELPLVFVVYPKIQPVRTELFLRDLWDSQWGGRGYMEDVTVLKSARPYQGADSWKRINWRMAARQQQLQVNLFETILPRAAHFILDGQSFLEDPEGLEDALSLLASVCLRLGEAGVPCGLSLPGGADHPPRNLFAADGAAPEDLLFALAEYRLREAPAWLREEEELEPYRLSGFDRDGLLRGSSRAGRICLLTREMESFRCWSLLEGLEAASLMVLTYREPPADLPALEFPVIPLDAVREGGRSR